MYGNFSFEITELISEYDKKARWIQKGKHLTRIDKYAPTRKALTEIASAVYRLDNYKIAVFWIQIDRPGFEKQLQQNTFYFPTKDTTGASVFHWLLAFIFLSNSLFPFATGMLNGDWSGNTQGILSCGSTRSRLPLGNKLAKVSETRAEPSFS